MDSVFKNLAEAGEPASQPRGTPNGDEGGCSLVVDGPRVQLRLYYLLLWALFSSSVTRRQ